MPLHVNKSPKNSKKKKIKMSNRKHIFELVYDLIRFCALKIIHNNL